MCAGYAFWDADKLSPGEVEGLKTFFAHCNFICPIVFFNTNCELARHLLRNGIGVRFLGGGGRIKSNWQIRKILKKYDLAFIQCYGRDAFEHYAFGARAVGLKVIFYLPHQHLQSKINNLHLRMSDKILVESAQQYSMLEEQSRRLYISMQKEFAQHVAIAGHGVNLERYYPVDVVEMLRLREKQGIDLDAKVIVCLGEFSSQNKQLEFIQQVCLKFATTAKQGKRMEFRFAVQNPLPNDLTDFSHFYLLTCCDIIDNLNLRRMMFLNTVEREQKFLDLLRAADIAVLSPEVARDEQSLAKILSLGKPVVTIDAWKHTTEFIEEHGCGKSCKSSDFNTVFSAILELLQNDILYKQSCNNAQMIARHLFDANHTVGEYEKAVI